MTRENPYSRIFYVLLLYTTLPISTFGCLEGYYDKIQSKIFLKEIWDQC